MKAAPLVWTAEEFIHQGSGLICLCGSTKFFFEAMEANRRLTFSGWVVLQCGSWGHSFHKYAENTNTDYAGIKTLHYQKILMSDAIVVVTDTTDYIGNSTIAEKAFAKHRGIPILYFNGENFHGTTTVTPYDKLEDKSLIENFEKINGTLGF